MTIISTMFALSCLFSIVQQERLNGKEYEGQTTCHSTCTTGENSSAIDYVNGDFSTGIDGDWIAVSVRVSNCRGFAGSLCSCKTYKGYKHVGLDRYKGACSNYAGGNMCGHGPAAHGLREY